MSKGDKVLIEIKPCKVLRIVKIPEAMKTKLEFKEGGLLHPLIATYLVYSNIAKIVDESGKELSLKEVINMFSDRNFWITFSVFLDLRKRGKKVEPGIEPNELILESEKTKVYVFEENALVKARDLVSLVGRSMKQNYRVLIAVVDMYGDVTYYEVNKLAFSRIERRE